ncbi:MAG: alpha/beta fold hydrolase [Paracoccaceae bacterium]
MLNLISHGDPGGGTPLLIAHGLFGSARNWGAIAKRLSDQRQVVAVDMRNHGQSEWFPTHSYDDLAGDLAEVIAAHGGMMDVLGHSMGGKAAMVLALKYPGLVRRMVIADIAPTAYSHTQIHLIYAMNNVDLSAVARRSDVEAQLGQIDDSMLRSFLLQSFDLKEKTWRLNLETLALEMDKILGFPQVDGSFEGDVLFLSGSESDYVSRDHRPRIKALFPKAKFARIPGAGHWLHAEKPREFGAAVRAYLNG